jgi:hypothetical protein
MTSDKIHDVGEASRFVSREASKAGRFAYTSRLASGVAIRYAGQALTPSELIKAFQIIRTTRSVAV